MTNYERIKAMSVEEMADFLGTRQLSCMKICKRVDTCNQYNFCYPSCCEGIKEWLESEVQG